MEVTQNTNWLSCSWKTMTNTPPSESEQVSVEQPEVSMESLQLEGAVCAFTRKSCEEAALGVGISFTKDLR